MKILLVANANSIHTQRWAKGLTEKGLEIGIFSLKKTNPDNFKEYSKINVWSLEEKFDFSKKDGHWGKIKYLKALPFLKKVIKEFQPDILHAHYASSYGLLGALSGFKPYFISVWGSDIYIFPNRSFLHRIAIMWTLNCADKIFSTSHDMAKKTEKLTDKHIDVIPFGVPPEKFHCKRKVYSDDTFTIGTSKKLEKIYGLDILIKAFATLCKDLPDKKLRLLLIPEGSMKTEYIELIKDLHIECFVEFRTNVSYQKIEDFYNEMDIVVFPSRSESFGVSAIEALLCRRVVVANKVGGLKEIFKDGAIPFLEVLDENNLSRILKNIIAEKPLPQNLESSLLPLYSWDENINTQYNYYIK